MAALNTGRLPVRLAPLVGRQRELQEVVDALARSRLMSLTGPGGTGKTRLALAAADAARGRFPGGVCWVELAPIDDPAIAPQAVADGLGIPEVPGQDATMTIAEHVGDHPVLLVLDNCEHLIGSLRRRWPTACCGPARACAILATSREPLGVAGETLAGAAAVAARPPVRRRPRPTAGRVRRGAAVRRARPARPAALRAHRRQRGRGRAGLPPAGRHAAGDRAGRGPGAGPVGGAARRAAGRPLPAADRRAPHGAAAPADAAGDAGLEPRPARPTPSACCCGGWRSSPAGWTLEAAEAVGAGGRIEPRGCWTC